MFSFFSSAFFRRQRADFFFSKKICQMQAAAGQNNKYDITKTIGLVQV
jgi:hypothetical protein